MRSFLAILLGATFASSAALAAGNDFQQLDTDGNGSLSRAETEKVSVDFSDADTDGNGKVSKSEYQAASGDGGQATDQGESTY